MIDEALIGRVRGALAVSKDSDVCAKELRELLTAVEEILPFGSNVADKVKVLAISVGKLPALLYVGAGGDVMLSAPDLDLSVELWSRVDLRVMLALVEHAEEILEQQLG